MITVFTHTSTGVTYRYSDKFKEVSELTKEGHWVLSTVSSEEFCQMVSRCKFEVYQGNEQPSPMMEAYNKYRDIVRRNAERRIEDSNFFIVSASIVILIQTVVIIQLTS